MNFWLLFVDNHLLLKDDQSPWHESLLQQCKNSNPQVFEIGEYQGRRVLYTQLERAALEGTAGVGLETVPLRTLLNSADPEQAQLLSRAAQINSWYRNHQFCSRCGSSIQRYQADLAAHCEQCQLQQYPRLSPCIIVLVCRQTEQGEQCLLAHAAHFSSERYSTLAGFIEAGETAEQAVAREVREEVGIEVDNIRYWKSQSWPFPHSLMLAFYADYAGGELQPDGHEIIKAQWFDPQHLPELPPKLAVSRDLIEGFVAGVHHRLQAGVDK